jgi:hypothetical protein
MNADDWKYNSPPNWPAPPTPNWRPVDGWRPDSSWPPAPEGWQFWVQDTPATPTVPAAPAAHPAPTAPVPLAPPVEPPTRNQRESEVSPAPVSTVHVPPSAPAVDTSVGLFGARRKARELGAEVERLTAANVELTSQLRELGALDLIELERRRTDLTDRLDADRVSGRAALAELVQQRTQLQAELHALSADLVTTRDDLVLQEVGVYQYTHPLDDSIAYKAELARIQDQIKSMNRVGGGAVHGSTEITMNGNLRQGQKMVKEFSKLLLRAYNNEADNLVRGMRPYKLDSGRDRLTKAKGTIERLGQGMHIVIDPGYHRLRIGEMELTADYIDKLAAEKEREKEERARLREERQAQAEFQRQREKLERERAHYAKALAALEANGDAEAAERLRAELGEIDKAIEDVDYRTANIRAGYVYVISNLGAFGERMVKVGMTRRLAPMDRIKELSDASVPFNFDVHAIHFSNDAVGVEAEMHRRLADRRVNRVNLRREFFYATPSEVRDLLADVAGDLLEYTDSAEAFEYHQSVNDADSEVAPVRS